MATLMSQGDNYGTHRRCDATCHDAKKPKCTYICGGRYHGKGTGSPELKEAADQFQKEWTAANPELAAQAGLPLDGGAG